MIGVGYFYLKMQGALENQLKSQKFRIQVKQYFFFRTTTITSNYYTLFSKFHKNLRENFISCTEKIFYSSFYTKGYNIFATA